MALLLIIIIILLIYLGGSIECHNDQVWDDSICTKNLKLTQSSLEKNLTNINNDGDQKFIMNCHSATIDNTIVSGMCMYLCQMPDGNCLYEELLNGNKMSRYFPCKTRGNIKSMNPIPDLGE